MQGIKANTDAAVVGLFQRYTELFPGEKPSAAESAMARIGELMAVAIARFQRYRTFPETRLPDNLADIQQSQLELVLMYENARLLFVQSVEQLASALAAMAGDVVMVEDGSPDKGDLREARQLNFINQAEAYQAGMQILARLKEGVREAPPRFAEVVELHSRSLTRAWPNQNDQTDQNV